jgi:hypothetical protein
LHICGIFAPLTRQRNSRRKHHAFPPYVLGAGKPAPHFELVRQSRYGFRIRVALANILSLVAVVTHFHLRPALFRGNMAL